MTGATKRQPGVVLLGLGVFATVASFAGSLGWPVELLSHFRVQFAWGFGLLALVLGAARAWRPALIAVVLSIVHAVPVVQVHAGGGDVPPEGARVRAVFLNVNTANVEHAAVLAYLRGQRADFVVVAEVDERWMQALAPLAAEHATVLARPRADNFGIALFSQQPVEGRFELLGGAGAPPTVIAHDAARGLTVIGTHPVPPIDGAYADRRDRQLTALAAHVAALEEPVLLLGDLNVTPWSPYFADLLADAGLRDSRAGSGVHASWPAAFPAPLRIPIDHALVSPHVRVAHRAIGPALGSDHLPVVVEIVLP